MRKARTLTAVLAAVAVAGAAAVTLNTNVAAQAEESAASGNASITVGTYKPRQAFQAYPGRSESMKKLQDMQSQAQQAQQNGDQQKLQQLSQSMQQEQQRIVQKFREDVDKVMPKVAKESGVDLVAMEVVYQGDGVQTKDLTKQVVSQLGGEMPKPRGLPGMMQQGQGKGQQKSQGQGKQKKGN